MQKTSLGKFILNLLLHYSITSSARARSALGLEVPPARAPPAATPLLRRREA